MKTIVVALLVSFSFLSLSFAGDLSTELKQLSSEATVYMSEVYSQTTGESIKVEVKAGLGLLKSDLARDVLEAAFEINSSDSLESYINDANMLTTFSTPVFWRSKCCQCGDCTNF